MKKKLMRIVTLASAVVMLAATTACGVTAHAAAAETRAFETTAPATPTAAEQTAAPVGADNTAVVYQVETRDGLMTIELPGSKWSEEETRDNTEMFTDGDCRILVDLYRSTDSVPATVKQDAAHPLTYAQTISTGKYQMFAVGYAATVDELTSIAHAISTIKMNPEKVTDAMLSHTAATTVQTTVSQPAAVTQTGSSITLYNATGSAVTLYGYTDGSWRTTKGTVYSVVCSGIWMSNGGTCLYTSKPSTQHTQSARKTGVSFPLYYSDGTCVTIYEYSDNTYRDELGFYYHKYNAGLWQCSDGTLLGLEYDPAPEEAMPTGVCFPVYDTYGNVTYIYEMTDGTYEDLDGVSFHETNSGMWERIDGALFSMEYDYVDEYEYDSTYYGADPVYETGYETSYGAYGADPVYETGNETYGADPVYETGYETEPYQTGVSFPLYDDYGNVIYVYEYSDGTYRDCCGMTYYKYNAGQWQSSGGAIYSLQPVSTYQDVVSDSYDDDCYCW